MRCLNEVSSQGELADKRPVKKASMDFVFRTYNIGICFNLYGNVRGLQIKVFSVGGGCMLYCVDYKLRDWKPEGKKVWDVIKIPENRSVFLLSQTYRQIGDCKFL